MSGAKKISETSEYGQYLLLETTHSEKRAKDILGTVIPLKTCNDPFYNYQPDTEQVVQDKNLTQIMQSLSKNKDEETVELTDIVAGREWAKDDQAKAQVGKLVSAYAEKHANGDAEITAGKGYRFTMNNPATVLRKKLFGCAAWKAALEDLYFSLPEGEREVCLVIGYMTASNIEVKSSRGVASSRGGHVEAPVTQIAQANGVPLPNGLDMNPSAGVDRARSDQGMGSTKIDGVVVLAIACAIINVNEERSLSIQAKYPWVKRDQPKIKSVSLGLPVRARMSLSNFQSGESGNKRRVENDRVFQKKPEFKVFAPEQMSEIAMPAAGPVDAGVEGLKLRTSKTC